MRICLILEGCYPYIFGGVSTWMHQYINEMKEHEFDFWGFRINRAVLKVVEPYQKEYVVTGYGRCGNTGAEGLKADFLYVENGDAVSLSRAKGKIVMVNGRVRRWDSTANFPGRENCQRD